MNAVGHIADQTLARPRASAARAVNVPWSIPEYFLVAQTAIPALLLVPAMQSYRTPLRALPFLLCVLGLGWYISQNHKRIIQHPAWLWLIAIGVWLVLMLAHPGAAVLSGIAQVALYIAVFSPVFWVPHLIKGTGHLRRLLWILLLCSGLNSAVGILQVYDPDRWLPKEFSEVSVKTYRGLLSYQGSDGTMIIRPPGLFDTPGAVCGPGAVAAILGLVFSMAREEPARNRFIAAGLAFMGLAVIYLTHVRSTIVVSMIGAVAFSLVLVTQRKQERAALCLALAVVIGGGALALAIGMSGEATLERFESLLEDDPATIYYVNRGMILEQAFDYLLFEYPLGAGPGRWGMIQVHFGGSDPRPPVFSELQPNSWLLDGGIVLLVLYVIAMLVNGYYEYRCAGLARGNRLQTAAAAVFAANIATAALVFSFVPFCSQVGIQYWFLAGALHGAVSHTGRQLGRKSS